MRQTVRAWQSFAVLVAIGAGLCNWTLPQLHGQNVNGTILGAVSDSSGAPIPRAVVTVINDLTKEKHTSTTGTTGEYLVPALPVGTYRVEVQSDGFKRYVQQGIVLEVNQNARVDARLELGVVTQEVLVTGNAAAVDTHQVQLGTVVDTQRINDLPLNGRNIYGLLSELPGVTGTSLQPVPDDTEGNQMNVNGSRVLQTSFLLDGGLNNNVFRGGGLSAPNPDALEEFRLITSNYNAEYGRSAGGIVNVITKSGTNQFHGTLYEYLRNNALDARSFFTPSVAVLRQNQFGGTVGGPVIRNKLFFFFSYEGTRIRAGSFINTARTPTAAMRAGNFSTLLPNQWPKDPDTGVVFAGGMIPATRLDPVAANLLKTVALPNTPDGRFQGSASRATNNDGYLGKGDYLVNSAHKLAVSAFLIRSAVQVPFLVGVDNILGYAPSLYTTPQNNITANETWIVHPTLLNQATFTFTRAPLVHADVNTTGLPQWGSQLTVAGLPIRPPYVTVTNGFTGGTFGDLTEIDQTRTVSDTLTWIHGAHSVKTGGAFQNLSFDYNSNNTASGMISSTGAFSGNSFADLELGRVGFSAVAAAITHLRTKNFGGFVQDDWIISRRITLNLGLRYEIFSPYTSTENKLSNWVAGQQSARFPTAPLGLVYAGDPGVPAGLIPTRYKDFAPRVGIAFDPFGDGKTAIRAGYGVFYSVGFAGLFNSNSGPPFTPSANVVETPSLVNPVGGLSVPFPPPAGVSQFVLPLNVAWMNQNNVTPYVQQYNFTIQKQLMRNLSLDVAYVGNVSRHLEQQRDANSPIYQPGKSTVANVNQRRPIEPGIIATLSEAETASNADYNALQMTLTRRFSGGFTILANYAYSKCIDVQSADQQSTAVGFTDSSNLRLDRGPCAFDIRNVFNLSFVYQSPKIKLWGPVGKHVLSDWQVNGIARYASGSPFSVTSGVDTNLNGNNNDRADLIGNPRLDTGRSRSQLIAKYFDRTAFSTPATGLDGTSGRDILQGPGLVNWDMSFFKNIPIHESHHLQFRAEFFNIFNKPNFSTPVASISNPNAGQILGAGAGRISQFGLKYIF